MKKISLSVLLVLASVTILFSQVPDAFNYQAVVRNSSGEIQSNKAVSFRISILNDSETGTVVYTETHAVSTNSFGLVNLEIGKGTVVSGLFSPATWNKSTFIKVELDPAGGTAYSHLATKELVSVPYAFMAQQVENDQVDDADADPTNEIQQISISGTLLELSNGGGSVILPTSGGGGGGDNWGTQKVVTDGTITGEGTQANPLSTPDSDPTNELQTLSKTGSTVTLSDGGGTFTDEVDDADADPTNEIQTLSISGTLLELSNGGGSVTLPSSGGGGGDNWGTQKVITDGTITGEGTQANPLSTPDSDPTNELQTLSLNGNNLSLSDGGGTVTLPSSGGGSSAWTTSGGNVYRSSGSVGIGTTPNSAFALDVTKSSDATAMRLKSGHDDVALVLDKHATTNFAYIMYNTNEVPKFHTGLNEDDNFEISSSETSTVKGIEVNPNGNVELSDDLTVGVNATIKGDLNAESDTYLDGELEVGSSITVSSDLSVDGDLIFSKGAGANKVLTSDANGNATWQTPASGGGSSLWAENGSDLYYTSGKVAIGRTSNPLNCLLDAYTTENMYAVSAINNGAVASLFASNLGTGAAAQFNGKIVIDDGTQGTGKVLTSDSDGNASWQTPANNSAWTTSAGNAYRASGNVGIGTSSPNYDLDIKSADPIVNIEATNEAAQLDIDRKSNSGLSAVRFYTNHNPTFFTGLAINSDNYWISTSSFSLEGLEVQTSGNVRISSSLSIESELNVADDVSFDSELEVDGDINVNGEINRTSTGSANMVPIAYGTITRGGNIESSSGNISVSKTTGVYTISITGNSYSWNNYITLATIIYDNEMGSIYTLSDNGKLIIRTFDSSDTAKDMYFSFVVYKP